MPSLQKIGAMIMLPKICHFRGKNLQTKSITIITKKYEWIIESSWIVMNGQLIS